MNAESRHTAMVRLLAETSVHVGIGQSTGALDLPVARERVSHLPFIPGSGVKGAFRVWAAEQAGLAASVDNLFGLPGSEDSGSDQGAGNLLVSDARLLLLPVRCLSDSYKWATCPGLLSRWARDCERSGVSTGVTAAVQEGSYLGLETRDATLALEEFEYSRQGDVPPDLVDALAGMVDRSALLQRLVILSDRDFTWFARYGLQVMPRNNLNSVKISQNLWYEESIPSETVMYVLMGQRFKTAAQSEIVSALEAARYIQMGGNETLGQGWFEMQTYRGPEDEGGGSG